MSEIQVNKGFITEERYNMQRSEECTDENKECQDAIWLSCCGVKVWWKCDGSEMQVSIISKRGVSMSFFPDIFWHTALQPKREIAHFLAWLPDPQSGGFFSANFSQQKLYIKSSEEHLQTQLRQRLVMPQLYLFWPQLQSPGPGSEYGFSGFRMGMFSISGSI